MLSLQPDPSTPENLWQALDRLATQSHASTAIFESRDSRLSYAELRSRVRIVELILREAGIERGDIVALQMRAGTDALVATVALTGYCACFPLNPALTDAELSAILSQVRPSALMIASQEERAPVHALAASLGIQIIAMPDRHSLARKKDVQPYSSELGQSARTTQRQGNALLMHTSATSGRAKLVPHTQTSLNTVFENTRRALSITSRDCLLLMSPLFHSQGIISAMAQLLAGGTVIVTNGFDATQFNGWLTELEITWYTCGPTTHSAVLNHLKRYPLPGPTALRFARSSGAPLPAGLARELTAALHAPLLNCYGLTETGAITSMTPELLSMRLKRDPATAFDPTVAGPTIGPEVAILTANRTLLTPREAGDESGEIVVRGPSVMAGYIGDPEAAAESFHGDWFRTGDYGSIDRDGCLHVTGRIKEIVNRGGQKIIPAEVEEVLNTHPRIRESAVFAIPHPTLGEDVACAVVLEGESAFNVAELRTFAGHSLSVHKLPRRLYTVDAIPRGSTGKPQRRILAERFATSLTLPAITLPGELYLETPRTTTANERRLHEIWARILGRDDLSFDEDFFLAGGDSLAAMTMLHEADQRFGSNLRASAAAFFDHPTIAMLASLLEANARPATSADEPSEQIVIVPIREEGPNPTLFCIPADGDEGLYFRRLARHAGNDWPFLLVRPGNTWHPHHPGTIPEAAAQAAALIQQAQPSGPCFLLGYCYGGLIAFETARMLADQGRDIRLILFDVPMPGFPALVRHCKLYLRRSLLELQALRYSRKVNPALVNARRFLRRVVWITGARTTPVFSGLWRFPIAQALYQQICQGYLPMYLPRPLNVPTLHFVSAIEPKMLRAEARNGWRTVLRANLTTRTIPGDHDTLLRESNLDEIAAEITRWLHDS